MFNTDKLIEELDAWTKVIAGNAHLLARALIANGLGPVVLTADIVSNPDGEAFYGVQWGPLSASEHNN